MEAPFTAFDFPVADLAARKGTSLIFKYSPKCALSKIVKLRLSGASWDVPIYFIDVITDKAKSLEIADAFDVFHASPQLLLIHDGECEVEWEQNEIHLNAIRTEIASL